VPEPEQRSHWYVNVAAVFHVPVEAESVFPAAATPEITGAALAAGTGTTTLEIAEGAEGDAPFTFVALTVERTTSPASALVREYVEAVAPGMLAQLAPLGRQRCHW
jgi:hypothetical protein